MRASRIVYGSSTTFTTEPSFKPSMFFSSAKLSSVTPSSWSEKHVRWHVSSRSISSWWISWTSSMLDTWIDSDSTPGLRIWTENPTSWIISSESESSTVVPFRSFTTSVPLTASSEVWPFMSVWPFDKFSEFDFACFLLLPGRSNEWDWNKISNVVMTTVISLRRCEV